MGKVTIPMHAIMKIDQSVQTNFLKCVVANHNHFQLTQGNDVLQKIMQSMRIKYETS